MNILNPKTKANLTLFNDMRDLQSSVLQVHPIGEITDTGIIKMPNSTDPLSLNFSGKYWCEDWLAGTIPQSSTYCIIEVSVTVDKYRVLNAYYPSYNTVFRNFLYDGKWSGWKLLQGHISLWSGIAKTGDTINTYMNTNIFGRILVTTQGIGMAEASIFDYTGTGYKNVVCYGGTISANNHAYGTFVYLQLSGDKITINNVGSIDYNTPGFAVPCNIVSIVGLP